MDISTNMDIMNKNIIGDIPAEMLFEILLYLHSSDIVSIVKILNIPKNIINQPVFINTHSIIECVFMMGEYEDKNLLKKLIKEGANPLIKSRCNTSAFYSLWCDLSLKFITEEKFSEIYDILFPGDLSFTRNGKCYSGIYHTMLFKIK